MRDLDERALQAREKEGAHGPDIDLDAYESEAVRHDYVNDLAALSDYEKERIILAGVDADEKGRSGTYIQKDTTVVHAR
nr:SufD family Fe-S cluster assembly protein [Desulfobacterales bacterium]